MLICTVVGKLQLLLLTFPPTWKELLRLCAFSKAGKWGIHPLGSGEVEQMAYSDTGGRAFHGPEVILPASPEWSFNIYFHFQLTAALQ